jgi:hypothetical protein
MVAIAYIETNSKEIQEAKDRKERLNLPNEIIPEQKIGEGEFMFGLDTIHCAFRVPEPDGRIKVVFHNGTNVFLKWNEEVNNRLKLYFLNK